MIKKGEMMDIEDIYSITNVKDGFFTIETNYGEEYIDFIELLECSNLFSKF